MGWYSNLLLRSLQVFFSATSLILLCLPTQAAERVYVSLGLLEISVSVESLEKYAREGMVSEELSAYTRYLNEKQREQLREVLTASAQLNTIAIAQFLYSPQGEAILKQLGSIMDTKARQGGFYAIRGALILAAAEEEGLTLLNFLKQFPTDGLRINSGRGLELVNELSDFIQETDEAVAMIQREAIEQSLERINPSPTNFPRNLQSPGNIPYHRQTIDLVDQQRPSFQTYPPLIDRNIPTNLYLPDSSSVKRPPLIVISHGLGSDRQTYSYIAEHLASYGFAVATIEHPGSNARQVQYLLTGLANEVSPPSELINRPRDLQFLLNYLERNYSTRLNLNQVGIFGQSYGAYTSLAIAGAAINYEEVADRCSNQETATIFNFSILLQCQLLRLPAEDYNFKDPRVKAIFAINPLTSQIFGENGISAINIPTLIVTGSADNVTPALAEQIRPFSWLQTPEKYLVLLKQGTHFSTLKESTEEGVPVPQEVIGPDPAIAQNYMKVLSLAFFKTYLPNQTSYKIYLTNEYTDQISRPAMPIFLLQSLPKELIDN